MTAAANTVFSELKTESRVSEALHPKCISPPVPAECWSPKRFAQEQIRGLVRRVFVGTGANAVKQIVFSSAERLADIQPLCLLIADCLAEDGLSDILLLQQQNAHPQSKRLGPESTADVGRGRKRDLRELAEQVNPNVWRIDWGLPSNERSLQSFLQELRRDFTYTIVQSPPVSESDSAIVAAQYSDGLVLAVSAQSTRRVLARTVKDRLIASHVRLIGAVLIDREFPIPERIYRTL